MSKNKTVVYIEKRPLVTEHDFDDMTLYIKKQGVKAKEDASYRNHLLCATGMYDEKGNLMREYM